jgi:hypothetical protein
VAASTFINQSVAAMFFDGQTSVVAVGIYILHRANNGNCPINIPEPENPLSLIDSVIEYHGTTPSEMPGEWC